MTDDFGLSGPAAPTEKSGAAGERGECEAPELVYGSAVELLHEQLLPTYVRSVTGKSANWCIEWYFHPEAVSRVAALWRSWEHLRTDPATGVSVWWRGHADHPMRPPRPSRTLLQLRHERTPRTGPPRTKEST